MEIRPREPGEAMRTMEMAMMSPKKIDQEWLAAILMTTTHKMKMIEKGREKGRERGKESAGKETDVITREAEKMVLETATETIMTTESIHMSVLTVMASGAEPVVPPFLPSTDLSGMKMRALRWWNTTRRESDRSGQESADREVNAQNAIIPHPGTTLSIEKALVLDRSSNQLSYQTIASKCCWASYDECSGMSSSWSTPYLKTKSHCYALRGSLK